MKLSSLLFLTPFVLVSCASSTGSAGIPLQERLRNPLVAERYWSEMAEHMADFARDNDPVMADKTKAGVIDAERVRALERVAQARALQKEGLSGPFQSFSLTEYAVGVALLRENILSFGTTFLIKPNPSVLVYLTTVPDPRETEFPDDTSLNLGEIQTPYGEQEYVIPEESLNPGFQTVVLYDSRLERLIGFAQLTK